VKTVRVIAVVVGLLMAGSVTVFAGESQGWRFEVTPYLWLAGIDGDLTVRDTKVHVNQSFSDLIDKVDFAGSAQLGGAYNDKFVIYSQLDYMALSESASRGIISTKVSSDIFLLSGAVGYRFHGGLTPRSTTDVLFGVRYANMDNKINVSILGSRRGSVNVTDAIIMVRPSIPLSQRWRFNPTLSIGAGDSNLVYELSPQVEYAFSDTWAGRIGYRRLYYDIDNSNGTKWKGALAGLMLGIGAKF
jgi:hypothetical protein